MPTTQLEPLQVPLHRFPEITGKSPPTIHAAINAGHLRTYLIGRRRYATMDDLRAWIEFLRAESDAGRPVVYRPRSSERAAQAGAAFEPMQSRA